MMVAFGLVLGSILSRTLLAVNWYTTPVISNKYELAPKSNVLQALGIPFDKDDIEEVFASNVKISEEGGRKYYLSGAQAIAFAYSGSGLWGPINGIVALNPDLSTLKAVTIIRHEETPRAWAAG